MRKIVEYRMEEVSAVQHFIDEGWQPWGSPVSGGDHWPHGQALVKYEETPEQPLIVRDDMKISFSDDVHLESGAFGVPLGEVLDSKVYERLQEYLQYWNPETEKYEIELGTVSEWVCTYQELIADIKKGIEEE